MTTVRPPLQLTEDERAQLQSMASSNEVPRRISLEAQALCLAAEGTLNAEIARRCQVSPDTVRRWRRRFLVERLDGVGAIAPGRGRKSSVTPELVHEVMRVTLSEPSPGGRSWSTRTLGRHLGVSKDIVARIWRQQGFHGGTGEAVHAGGASGGRLDGAIFALDASEPPFPVALGTCLRT